MWIWWGAKLVAVPVSITVAVFLTSCSTAPPPTPHPATSTVTIETPGLQPGPHSAVADMDLPEGTVQCADLPATDPHDENWCYSAPYDAVVAFLQKQFATGRRYDSLGATYWRGLPPCYEANHQSPPLGARYGDTDTEWTWSDGTVMLIVDVLKGRIVAKETSDLEGMSCLRA
jgi:hypothetical protein